MYILLHLLWLKHSASVAEDLSRATRDYKEAKEKRISLEKQQPSGNATNEPAAPRRPSVVAAPAQPAARRQSNVGLQRRLSRTGKEQNSGEDEDIVEKGAREIEEMQKECSAAYSLTSSKIFRKSSQQNEKVTMT